MKKSYLIGLSLLVGICAVFGQRQYGPVVYRSLNEIVNTITGNGANSTANIDFTGAGSGGLNINEGGNGNGIIITSTNSPVTINGIGATITGGSGNVSISGSGGIIIGNALTTKAVNKATTAISTSTSPNANNEVMFINTTGLTETLPTAVGILGRTYTYKLTVTGSATIATTSSQTIDASTTYSLSAQYKYVTITSDGSNWKIIANN